MPLPERLLPPDEERELRETAQVFETVLQANADDVPALEALREVYTRLGEVEKLVEIVDRIAAIATGERRPVPVRFSAPPPPPAPPPPFGQSAGPGLARRPWLPLRGRPARPGRARLGDLLVAEAIITPQQLHDAVREQRRSRERLGAVLARRGLVTEERLVELLSKEHGLPSVTLDGRQIEPHVLALVPGPLARKYEVLPLSLNNGTLTLVMVDPTNVVAMDAIAARTGLQVLPVVALAAAVRAAIERCYAAQSASMAEILSELANAQVEVVDQDEAATAAVNVIELKESADEAPVVRLVNMVLADAIRKGASDLHWEPYEKTFRVRFRLDGVLHDVLAPPKRHEAAIVSRLKIMASLDIAERRVPQDGRIKIRYGAREVDFRVSVLPTIFGEKAVLRVLDREALQLDLAQLGFDPWSLEHFTRVIHQPYGMVLITGPTGSGKTTTLYSAIQTINAPDHNIMTAEDPVEYNLHGVNQVQINDGIGRTFASVLRSFLRQDPDVILVGETRDLETAQIAVRAALTGHLVFTTLHTNDCPSTVARLVDMGIPPFLLSSSLLLVVAQRLGRRLCRQCREPYEGSEADLVPYGHVPADVGRCTFYRPRGCAACSHTGMKGRVAIYEVMPVTDAVRDLVLHNGSATALRDAAQQAGMRTLRQAGLAKVVEGVTTVEEILRVTLA